MNTKLEAALKIKASRPDLNMIQIMNMLNTYLELRTARNLNAAFIARAVDATGHTEEEVIAIMNS